MQPDSAHQRLPIVIDGLNEAEDLDWKKSRRHSRDTAAYPYVLIVCTLRAAFVDEALPADIHRLEIPDFDHDTDEAMGGTRALPIDAPTLVSWGYLRHPLTLRLFCG